ncbi:MAG: sigma-54-dependent Fis family transcriptional regulator [Planctomycetes bacterium]|nr:sigma-54-dependent Fis family transcriptional regulator [Planctomycetota bacterium]
MADPLRNPVRDAGLKPRLLSVDDEPGVLASLQAIFEGDYNFITASDGNRALEILDTHDIPVAVIDLGLPDISGLNLLKRIKESHPALECIMLTANTALTSGIEAMKLGAYDYLVKPFDVEHIQVVVRNALEKGQLAQEICYRRMDDASKDRPIIGRHPLMRKLSDWVEQVAPSDVTALIIGESGTGKELVARAIHRKSPRQNKPFIAVNCGAIPAELTESELFGHEKGAFTGAERQKPGKFELANHGTIFLDEISVLPFGLQSKLLRVLQEKNIERVGGTKLISLDVRVVAATNVDLKQLSKEGKFREDLYYRLNIVPVALPPLRDRKSDVPFLVEHFLGVYNRKYQKNITGIPKRLMSRFMDYRWPGNIRELENVIQRLMLVSGGDTLSLKQLPLELAGGVCWLEEGDVSATLDKAVAGFEREYITAVLEKSNYRMSEVSERLGIHRNTLGVKIKQLGIVLPDNLKDAVDVTTRPTSVHGESGTNPC